MDGMEFKISRQATASSFAAADWVGEGDTMNILRRG
jgi:hypothetical protein